MGEIGEIIETLQNKAGQSFPVSFGYTLTDSEFLNVRRLCKKIYVSTVTY
mgnify:CR=1 FL=1